MITLKKCISNPKEYQCGTLPPHAKKLDVPEAMDEMMGRAAPIAVGLCLVVALTVFVKCYRNHTMVINLFAVFGGFLLGGALLIVHEWLHAIVYPSEADVVIGKLKGRLIFVALASYPLKRARFIFMCLLPFLLGIIPLFLFMVSPADRTIWNGLLFGMACMGMVSPYPDAYHVYLVLKQTKAKDAIMFYEDGVYRIEGT